MVQAIPSIKERSSGAMASLGRMREIVPQDLRMSSGLKPGLNWARMSPLKPRPFKAYPLGEDSPQCRSSQAQIPLRRKEINSRGVAEGIRRIDRARVAHDNEEAW